MISPAQGAYVRDGKPAFVAQLLHMILCFRKSLQGYMPAACCKFSPARGTPWLDLAPEVVEVGKVEYHLTNVRLAASGTHADRSVRDHRDACRSSSVRSLKGRPDEDVHRGIMPREPQTPSPSRSQTRWRVSHGTFNREGGSRQEPEPALAPPYERSRIIKQLEWLIGELDWLIGRGHPIRLSQGYAFPTHRSSPFSCAPWT